MAASLCQPSRGNYIQCQAAFTWHSCVCVCVCQKLLPTTWGKLGREVWSVRGRLSRLHTPKPKTVKWGLGSGLGLGFFMTHADRVLRTERCVACGNGKMILNSKDEKEQQKTKDWKIRVLFGSISRNFWFYLIWDMMFILVGISKILYHNFKEIALSE